MRKTKFFSEKSKQFYAALLSNSGYSCSFFYPVEICDFPMYIMRKNIII